MSRIQRVRGFISRFCSNLVGGLVVGARGGVYIVMGVVVMMTFISSCQRAVLEDSFKQAIVDAENVKPAWASTSTCAEAFVLMNFNPDIIKLASNLIDQACIEFGIIISLPYDDVVKTMMERQTVIAMHDDDNICAISNIHSCTTTFKEDPLLAVIMIDGRYSEALSAVRHEVFHVLFAAHGISGQQTHHLILRKFNLCGMIYSHSGGHLCGDISDGAVQILNSK